MVLLLTVYCVLCVSLAVPFKVQNLSLSPSSVLISGLTDEFYFLFFQINKLQAKAEGLTKENTVLQEELRQSMKKNHQFCKEEVPRTKGADVLKGSLVELHWGVVCPRGCICTDENWQINEKLLETEDELGKYQSHCNIHHREKKSLVAKLQGTCEEQAQNGYRLAQKQDIFPGPYEMRVLNLSKELCGSLRDEYRNELMKNQDGCLALEQKFMACQENTDDENANIVSTKQTQERNLSDKMAAIDPEHVILEIKPDSRIRDKEVGFLESSPKPNKQDTGMEIFLDNFQIASENSRSGYSEIAPNELSWMKHASPVFQDDTAELQSDNCRLRQRVQDLEAELCEASLRQSLAESAYQQSRLQMDDLLNQLDNSSDIIHELETCCDINVEEKSEFDSQLRHTERQLTELRVSLEQTEEENGDLERKLLESEKHVQRLEAQLQMGAKQKDQLIYELEEEKEMANALQQDVLSLQKGLLSSRRKMDFYKREIGSKEVVEDELKANNSKLKRRNNELEEELNKIQSALRRLESNQVELQEDLLQTHRILDEVQLDYKIVSEEKDALNEELKAFYERHRELKMTYRLCVHEKNEKEQEIAVLVAKVEDSLSEAASKNCCLYPQLNQNSTQEKKMDKCDGNRTSEILRCTVIEGEDLHPLFENTPIKISLARMRSPYLKDEMDTKVYCYSVSENFLERTKAACPVEPNMSHDEAFKWLGNAGTVAGEKRYREQLQEVELLLKQCRERHSFLEKDIENNKSQICSLQLQLGDSQQQQLKAHGEVSQLQRKHEDLQSAFEKCNEEKRELHKKISDLARKVRDLQKKHESQRRENLSLRRQLRLETEKNDDGRSEIFRINKQCIEQKLYLDASEFGMNFF